MHAAQYDSVAILTQLIEQGYDTRKSLHLAMQYGQSQAAKLLIPHAKDINISYKDNTLPIQLAYNMRCLGICADLFLSHQLQYYSSRTVHKTLVYTLQHTSHAINNSCTYQ